jgi:hypothetical protein
MNGSENISILKVELPSDLAKRVNRIAAEQGHSPSEIIRAAILKGLARIGDGTPPITDRPTAPRSFTRQNKKPKNGSDSSHV